MALEVEKLHSFLLIIRSDKDPPFDSAHLSW